MRHYEPFLDHPNTLEYKTMKIGEGLERPEDINRSHFKNVVDYVDLMQINLEEDLRISMKNIEFLRYAISSLDESSREDLSAVTKDIGNKIIFMYDNLAISINEQRCLNLHLNMEISNLNKEKNTIRHEIKNLTMSIKNMETLLGVDPDPKFDNLTSQNIFK